MENKNQRIQEINSRIRWLNEESQRRMQQAEMKRREGRLMENKSVKENAHSQELKRVRERDLQKIASHQTHERGCDFDIRHREARMDTIKSKLKSLDAKLFDKKAEQEKKRMLAENCREQARSAALRGNASCSMGLPDRGLFQEADKNFRAVEELGLEVREISEEAKQLRQEMGEDLRKLRELASVRAGIIREREEVKRKVTELASQLDAYKRLAAECATSANFYREEADRLTTEAQQKTSEAHHLKEEARKLAEQL